MRTLVGQGRRSIAAGGPVLARAAHLDQDGAGRVTLSDELLTEAAKRYKRGDEMLDIVLVTRDAAPALLLRLPDGLALAGVVAEQPLWSGASGNVAVVSGVEEALTAIPDGEWVIVDSSRGRVVVEPDITEVARLQSPEHKPRLLLGAAHTPACTQSGLEVPVWASVLTRDDLAEALGEGADGIVIAPGGDLLPLDAASDSPDALLPPLLEAAETAGGGHVALFAGPDLIDPLAVLKLAAQCELLWLLRPETLFLPVEELRRELQAFVEMETDARRPVRMPQLAAVVPDAATLSNAADTEDFSPEAFDEIILIFAAPESLPPLGTALSLPPLRIWLASSSDEEAIADRLPLIVAAGAAGIIVRPPLVSAAKDAIRELE